MSAQVKSEGPNPSMQEEGGIKVEARPSISTHICSMLDGGIMTVSQRSHDIPTPSMPSPCTAQIMNGPRYHLKSNVKSEGPIYGG